MTGTTLITGANRGIGLELVRQYAQAGWRVFATCRDPENALELNRSAGQLAGGISVHRLDVTDPRHIVSLVDAVGGAPIDILFNNAGIAGPINAHFGATDTALWLGTFEVNTIAPLRIMEAFMEAVARSRRRIMANLSSHLGSIANNRSGSDYPYRSSKAALNAVVRGVAIDLQPKAIIVLALHPGWVQTDMGGPKAPLTVQESVASLRALLERVSLADSGRFLNFDGAELPW
jgi:NAD(P)-dependent dehydrogenase (short-subunit alcohol dehydrogenase family)